MTLLLTPFSKSNFDLLSLGPKQKFRFDKIDDLIDHRQLFFFKTLMIKYLRQNSIG